MGLLVTTIPNAMNFMINPIVSFRSDCYRSKWGRRIPFLLWATPFVKLFLIMMGYSNTISVPIHALISRWINVSLNTVNLGLIAVLMICFQFFNMFIVSVYYYLFNDVVPDAYLACCMAQFRVVGSLAGLFYSFFIYKYAATHMQEIFLGSFRCLFLLLDWSICSGILCRKQFFLS
jgi:hypothetical protein